MKTIEVFGLKRCGHHAIITWILNNLPFTMFVNDPLATCRCAAKCKHYQAVSGKPLPALLQDQIDIAKLQKLRMIVTNCDHPETVMYNLEDRSLETDAASFTTGILPAMKILILRDPYNTFASRIKGRRKFPRANLLPDDEALRLWKQHATESMNPKSQFTSINYNKWFLFPEYRKSIGEQIGLTSSEDALQSVATWGGGSSFDGFGYEGRAQEMSVLKRYLEFLHDKSFLDLFDEETHNLTRTIFDFNLPRTLI